MKKEEQRGNLARNRTGGGREGGNQTAIYTQHEGRATALPILPCHSPDHHLLPPLSDPRLIRVSVAW